MLLYHSRGKSRKTEHRKQFLLAAGFWLPVTLSMVSFLAFDAAAYENLPPSVLAQRIEDAADSGYIILDIRSREDYEEGHIPGALNIPLRELGYRLYELDKTKDIIVYCNIGAQSKVACEILANAGFKDVYNLTDGLKAWDYAITTGYGGVTI